MSQHLFSVGPARAGGCCISGLSRRGFLGAGAAAGGFALSGLTWPLASAAEGEFLAAPARTPLPSTRHAPGP